MSLADEKQKESAIRGAVLNLLRPLAAFAVENVADNGTPDVGFVGGWLELKTGEFPQTARGCVRVKVRPSQRVWLKRWAHTGGRAWTLTVVDGMFWFLHDGAWAAENLGRVVESEFKSAAEAIWVREPPGEELRAALTRSRSSEIAEAERQRDVLAASIAQAARTAGVYNGETALTGPDLILLLEDMARAVSEQHKESDG